MAELAAAILNNEPMGFYSPNTVLQDAKRHDLKVLPVNVTRSRWDSTLERDAATSDAALTAT